jgi:hypothetical protein
MRKLTNSLKQVHKIIKVIKLFKAGVLNTQMKKKKKKKNQIFVKKIEIFY